MSPAVPDIVARLPALAAALASVAVLAPGAEAACALETGERVRVEHVIDGDTVALADGREVRLVGIQAPKLPLGRRGFAEWPLAPQARQALDRLARGQSAELRYGGARADRHGRILAHLFLAPAPASETAPVWVQAEMVARGLARVYSFPDNRSCVGELLSEERAARAAGAGIWGNPYYAVRSADDIGALEDLAGTFQLVEGRVEDVAFVGGRVYLNFGDDYRHDFTVTIEAGDRRRFDDRGEALRSLEGQLIRVRGWIALINGPMIELTHPEQIERLAGPARGN